MQTIYRTANASSFTIYANDLINSDIPSTPKNILLYLLSKPSNWQLKTHDLRKQLGLTNYAIKKGLRWLLSAGFAAYTRLKSGHTIWRVFDKPQAQHQTAYSPVSTPQVEIPQVAIQPVLINTETESRKKPLPEPEPIPDQQENIVVGLVFPEKLTIKQSKACKHIIKKAPIELQQEVLFALAYAMANQRINSVPAYLQGLVKRALDGSFEPINSQAKKERDRLVIPLWQGHGAITPSKPEKAKSYINQARSALRGIL
jgi:hypothetical protein